eukprot:595528-Amphidinium_carterae.1
MGDEPGACLGATLFQTCLVTAWPTLCMVLGSAAISLNEPSAQVLGKRGIPRKAAGEQETIYKFKCCLHSRHASVSRANPFSSLVVVDGVVRGLSCER